MSDSLFPLDRQIAEALSLGRRFSLPASYQGVSKILLCGMGGSAIGGNVVRTLARRRMNLPFVIYRTSEMPPWLDERTLAIFSSYSGNTPEVLGALRGALKGRAKIVTLTSGGELARLADRKKLPCFLIPAGLPPRCAVGYLTFSLLSIFLKLGRLTLPGPEVREILDSIRSVSPGQAEKIALQMKERSIYLYGVSGITEALCLRWRSQLAENAKTLASHHLLPESFHNEIEGWRFPSFAVRRSLAVFFEDREDPARIRRQRRFFQKLIRRRGGRVLSLPAKGRSLLARVFYLIALGDRVSFELARLNGVEALPIPSIEAVKKII